MALIERWKLFVAAFLGCSLLGPVTFVMAEDEESASGGIMEEVVVTARRREEKAQAVPIPITAMSGEQLETRNITEIRDVERLSPNTSIDYSSVNGTATQVFIRGIGQSNWSSTQDPKIGIYVDGIYLSRPQGGLVDLMDVAQVEVLRGPQGTLFGRNTTAGLIQIINNKPVFENEASVRLGGGTANHSSYGFMVNRPITDNLAARFALYGKETDGFIVNSLTGNDRGNESSLSYRASLLWEAGDLSALLTFDRFEQDERAPLGSCHHSTSAPTNGFLAGGLPAISNMFGLYDKMYENCVNTSRDVSIDTTNNESITSNVDAIILNLKYDFDWGEVTSLSGYREIDNFNGSWGWVMGNGPGANFLEILDNPSKNEIFSQEIRISGGNENLDWVVGAYFFNEDSEESVAVPLFRDVQAPSPAAWPFFYAPTGALNADGTDQTIGDIAIGTQIFGSRTQWYEVTNKNNAFFAEATYAVNEKLDITVGARYTSDDREFLRYQSLYGGAFDPTYLCPGMPTIEPAPGVLVPTSNNCFQEVSYTKTTPRVIASYAVDSDLMVYASYSMGYSSGGFNQDVRMRPYLPEVSNNFEAGFKSDLMDRMLRLNGTVFYNTYENQQLTVGRIVNGQPTADLINAQEAVLWGVEYEVIAQLSGGWAVSSTGGYLSGEYTEFTVQDNIYDPVTLEESIVTRDLSTLDFGNGGSEISFDVSMLHVNELSSGGDVTTSIGYGYKDAVFGSLENTPSSRMKGYWLLDGRMTWNLSNGRTRVSLWGTNLLDKDYVDTMLYQGGDIEVGGTNGSLGMLAKYWGNPRRMGLEISHDL